VETALKLCGPAARYLFGHLQKRLLSGSPYGFVATTVDDLARDYDLSLASVEACLTELRKHKLIRRGRLNMYYSPLLLAQLTMRIKK